jgi:hypothetical protein
MDPETQGILNALIAASRWPKMLGSPSINGATGLADALQSYGALADQSPLSGSEPLFSEPAPGPGDNALFQPASAVGYSGPVGGDSAELDYSPSQGGPGLAANDALTPPDASTAPFNQTDGGPPQTYKLAAGSLSPGLQQRDPLTTPGCSFCHQVPPNWDPFAPQLSRPIPAPAKSDRDRQKILEQCQDRCLDQVQAGKWGGRGPGGADRPGQYRKCVRQCMEANGYRDY